jgi:hypothetical protein
MAQAPTLTADALVLDVGGGAAHDSRANWVIDLTSWENRNWFYSERGELSGTHDQIPPERWVQRDICDRDPWPFEDGQFDFVICSHTLEDVRDPVGVCREMMRVGRAGWITTPAAVTELTRGIESPHWCGWRHHRWLVEREGDGIVFLAKPHNVNDPTWPAAVRSPRFLRPGALEPLSFYWEGSFPVREEITIDGDVFDARLDAIAAAARRADPVGSAVIAARSVAGAGYREGRRTAGRLVRRVRR